MSWEVFAREEPEMTAFGRERLDGKVAYIATTRADGSPRVHPVTPIVGDNRLFVFMEPTSPKGKDLMRDSRFALHCSVENNTGGEGEFVAAGVSSLVTDPPTREVAARFSSYTPVDRYILFELVVTSAQSTRYVGGAPRRSNWRLASHRQ